jgi:hypothetical protein
VEDCSIEPTNAKVQMGPHGWRLLSITYSVSVGAMRNTTTAAPLPLPLAHLNQLWTDVPEVILPTDRGDPDRDLERYASIAMAQ